MVPGEADQVTDVFVVLVTTAVNCMVAEDTTEAVDGFTVTTIEPGVATMIWNAFDPDKLFTSVTCTTKAKTPILLGFPEIVPVDEARVRPEGNDPDGMLKE